MHNPHNDALVIEAQIDHVMFRRILIDRGASANMLSFSTYVAFGCDRGKFRPNPTPLVGFVGEPIRIEGCVSLHITLG